MTGITIKYETIPAICWDSKNWVKFKFNPSNYKNIITFLEESRIYFLAEMTLDFTKIPYLLHGKGKSQNLLQYLANNVEDISLIRSFLQYFVISIVQIKYISGKMLNFHFTESSDWQNMTFIVTGYVPPTTTTTTTTEYITTTLSPTTSLLSPPMMFELFGQLFNV